MSQQVETIEVKGKKPICITFNAPINTATAQALVGAVSKVTNDKFDEVHLFLSTPGGTTSDGIATYHFLRGLPIPLITYNIGSVDSIGNVIYQAGGRKISARASSFMFHGVGVDISNARLELKQLRERMEYIQKDQDMISDIIVRHTNLTKEDVNSLFLEMEFMNAEKALERGVTDEVRDIHLPLGMPIMPLIFQG